MLNKLALFTCVIILLSVFAAKGQTYFVSPIAGTGTYAYSGDGGPATAAQLNGPAGIVVDDTGNIFFCDESNNRIRKIDTKGIITTIAGNGAFNSLGDGGPATNASLASPTGLAIDDSDDVYIADWGNNRIRKVNRQGIITTIAGTGKNGFSGDGGPADSADLRYPYGVGVDKWGNIYIADAANERVRIVDTNGIINTFAGTGVGFKDSGDGGLATGADINFPTWVWPDNKGNVYIANAVWVKKVNSGDTISTVYGNNFSVTFMEGGGAFDDSDNFYFAGFYEETVRKVYASNNTITTIGGTGVQGFKFPYGYADSAELSFPYGVACDKYGNLFLADNGNQRIRELSPCSSPITMSPQNPHICRGVSIALNAQGHNYYSWSPGNSLRDSVGYSVIATPSVTTTYTVSGLACYGSATIVVTVDTITKPADLKITPDTSTICNGQNVTLSVTGSTNYTWSPVWGLNNSNGSTVVASPTASTTYVVTEATCSATDTAIVNVNPVPSIYVYPATTTALCVGQTVTLYEGGANDFQWTPMTGLDTTNADSVNATPTITTTYTIVGTSLGCKSLPYYIQLTVYPIPTVSITPSTPGVCTGGNTIIIASGARTYVWSPFSSISDTLGDTVTVNPTITTTYSVTGTGTAGCVSPTDTFVVNVDTMPIISVNPPSASICQGTNTTLVASGAPAYMWSPSTGLSSSTGDSVIANPTANTTYIVTGINVGCASQPDTVAVNVAQAPNQPSITVSVTGDSLISSAGSNNQWNFNGQPVTDSTRQVLIIKGHPKGTYTVTVTNPANGCSATSNPTTGIGQLSVKGNQLSIYPNPANNQLTIISEQLSINNIVITNVLGQTVLKSPSGDLGVTKQILDVSTFAEGMYFISVTLSNKTITQKLLITR